ncbi:hypothetical protein AX16_001106 [Volvariella volvacea WC 439]|nr:hypothetical protein AX16_001106 [Volvariella volvacea WC 439]
MTFTERISARFHEVCARITLNRITVAFFLFSFVHCFAQGIIQSLLVSVDVDYTSVLTGIIKAANIPPRNISFLHGPYDELRLQMCNDIPYGLPISPCTDIFPVPKGEITISPDDMLLRQTISNSIGHGLVVSSVLRTNDTTIPDGNAVRLTDRDGNSIPLPENCTGLLLYPKQILYNLWREDLTFIILQFWLFAISMIALMNDSAPHILAVLCTRGLLSAWSIYAVWRTKHYERQFTELINSPRSPCQVNLFGDYFKTRTAYELPDLLLNATAVLTAGYLSISLLKVYSTQSFKRLGAPDHIVRILKFFMAVLACLQLEVFVLLAAICLWVDVLFNTAIKLLSEHTDAYQAVFILTAILLLPWIATGWYGIRREMKSLLLVFLGIAFLFIVGWSVMFYSIVYRATFMEWPFFACLTVASFILIVSSMGLSVICRLNFDRGLAQYLHAEAALASLNFTQEVFPHDEERGTSHDKDKGRSYCKWKKSVSSYADVAPALLYSQNSGIAPPTRDLQPIRRPPSVYSRP